MDSEIRSSLSQSRSTSCKSWFFCLAFWAICRSCFSIFSRDYSILASRDFSISWFYLLLFGELRLFILLGDSLCCCWIEGCLWSLFTWKIEFKGHGVKVGCGSMLMKSGVLRSTMPLESALRERCACTFINNSLDEATCRTDSAATSNMMRAKPLVASLRRALLSTRPSA